MAPTSSTRKNPRVLDTEYILEDQIGFLLRVCMQRHTTIFTSQMVGDLTQTQFAALARLVAMGRPCSQNHLGRLIQLDTATIKGVVDRLRSRRLVLTKADPEDRRRRYVHITDAGRQLMEAAVVVATKITKDTLSPLNSAEAGRLVHLLKKLSMKNKPTQPADT